MISAQICFQERFKEVPGKRLRGISTTKLTVTSSVTKETGLVRMAENKDKNSLCRQKSAKRKDFEFLNFSPQICFKEYIKELAGKRLQESSTPSLSDVIRC